MLHAMPRRVRIQDLETFCLDALQRAGVGEEDARTTTQVLVTTDSWGVFTHGTKALRLYLRRLRGGGIRAKGRPRIVAEGPAWARVDGDSALGMVTSSFAMHTALDKAAQSGVGYVGVSNSCHYGAAGYYAALALPRSMIGFAMANDIPTVNAPGAAGSVLGSNPFAFAVPAGEERPILLDMATATVAGGKVYAASALGSPIPATWLVDREGAPTTDSSLFPDRASLTPLGGYKGYGLALMVEVLSAVLPGAALAWQVKSWTYDDPSLATGHGAGFLALNIETFMPPAQFRSRIDQLIRGIRGSAKAPGAARILLPGEREFEARDRALASGLELPDDVAASLRAAAAEAGMDPPSGL
jgi:LDH2 family malate/lactate/ureidoglycolate dehydrogenase